MSRYKQEKCPKCNGSGYGGRIVRAWDSEIILCSKCGGSGIVLVDRLLEKRVKAGILSPETNIILQRHVVRMR
jgi:DnaJ-class molecular chaperone